jgi:hypothetical protein
MEKFFLTIMHSWGSDTPQEVFWGLNDLITCAKTKGFDNKGLWFEDPVEVSSQEQEQLCIDNDTLVKELSEFFENKLK